MKGRVRKRPAVRAQAQPTLVTALLERGLVNARNFPTYEQVHREAFHGGLAKADEPTPQTRSYEPLIAPAVKPAMKRRAESRNTIITGAIAIVAPSSCTPISLL